MLGSTLRGLLALTACLGTTAGLLAATPTPANAGQVGVTVGIQGAGLVRVVEGSLEDGATGHCERFDNQDHRVTAACPRVRNDEPFEAWVWLRAEPAPFPMGEWRFDGWDGCDTTRIKDGATECAVRSGAFSSDERYPVARFRDVVEPTVSGLQFLQVPDIDGWFDVSFNASGGSTECRDLGHSEWAACTSGHRQWLREGTHRVQVRAVDPSGNVGAAELLVISVNTWFDSGPAARTNSTSARFDLRTGAGTAFWCSLDQGAWTRCGDGPAESIVHGGLADGEHVFRAQARDGSWVDPAPAEWRWTVDTVAPVSILTPMVLGRAAEFLFSSEDAFRFECRLDRPGLEGSWEHCAGSKRYTDLGEGEHAFTVRAYDRAGNVETSPQVHRWTVDTTAPTTSLAATTGPDTATFVFAAAGAERFECRLAGPGGAGPWARCTSPTTYSALPAGQHRFEVRATDTAGNVEPVPASHVWTVLDSRAPDTSVTSGPSGFVLASSATFGLGSEPGATFRCTLDGTAVPCGATLTASGLRSGTHTLTAAAVDAHGNVDPTPATRTWTVPATARELRIARGWRLRQVATSYAGSRLESSRKGAQLTRSVTGARSVALVVGKGRRHGAVKVYAGSRLLKTVRLAASRDASRVLVPVATFATPYTGSLRIVVATPGRPVRIEGLGVAT